MYFLWLILEEIWRFGLMPFVHYIGNRISRVKNGMKNAVRGAFHPSPKPEDKK